MSNEYRITGDLGFSEPGPTGLVRPGGVLRGQAFEQAIHKQRYLDVCNSHRALQQECDSWRDTAIEITQQRDQHQQTCAGLDAELTVRNKALDCALHERDQWQAQATATQAHLEQQQTATYQAVEREHQLRQQVANFTKQLLAMTDEARPDGHQLT